MVHPALPLALLAVLCACSSDEAPAGKPAPAGNAGKPVPKAQPSDGGPAGEQPRTENVIQYRGPALRAAFDKQRDEGLRVTVSVPGAGYHLRQDGIEYRGNAAVVLLTLDEPNPEAGPLPKSDSSVAYVVPMQDITANPSGEVVNSVRVEVAEVTRGRAYLVQPAHLLAAVVPVPK